MVKMIRGGRRRTDGRATALSCSFVFVSKNWLHWQMHNNYEALELALTVALHARGGLGTRPHGSATYCHFVNSHQTLLRDT